MYKVICVTNRAIAGSGFIERISEICGGEDPPDRLILREKDLSREEYALLAERVWAVCGGVRLSLHSYCDLREISGDIHLSFGTFMSEEFQKIKDGFDTAGVSVHSADEAAKAEKAGADYLIAGHIFATECKKGLPPRGVDFLHKVCGSVNIPVYAIGGITPDNAGLCAHAGAAGVCVMSGLMREGNSGELTVGLRKSMEKGQRHTAAF